MCESRMGSMEPRPDGDYAETSPTSLLTRSVARQLQAAAPCAAWLFFSLLCGVALSLSCTAWPPSEAHGGVTETPPETSAFRKVMFSRCAAPRSPRRGPPSWIVQQQ